MLFRSKNHIIIISDCVDWLTVKTNNPAFDIVKWIDTTYQKTILNKKADGVITISKFLDNYYKKTNMTVLIPPLSPFIYKELCLINDERKVIVYAGIPFRIGKKARNESDLKDRIDKIIILLCEAKDRGANFKLDIYGFTKNEYLFSLPLQSGFVNRLGDFVEFHGIKSNSEVVKEISKADFTILIRDVKRDTVAGFPTKVSESISCGTPVITNKTSDIDDYVIEEKNGFFIEDNSIEKIIQILKIDSYEVLKMKSKCLETNIFYYKFYLDKMANFLSRIESKTQ